MRKSAHHDTISARYQSVSSRYDLVKNLPYAFAERETLLAALPDLTGRSVLDAASMRPFSPPPGPVPPPLRPPAGGPR
ncbi:hypothetical protein J7W19_31750 [Streptomyces mobaraensis NBRC 13819 = DSM 40847]|uniref:Uncharacterized protein n=2 Tax=Streptomyces mobaraensis TaxID=35621 RepID=A0A5N5W449_STRMB|nr:hypothetical protein [Streptomyces mobaraensis]EMF00392.1 hypothetical protein H340_11805 [Streptomyces mobaraensis NBRC 13819 = DSM 40847]KAB7839573.1 hypothetical protein FRZ00_21850 [Streptomyces mobaraensis]QTT77353.1 hypothetical protein J7W19_31750 [Streptomyces mobaraensis NBRC 13819 = DSM 40847]